MNYKEAIESRPPYPNLLGEGGRDSIADSFMLVEAWWGAGQGGATATYFAHRRCPARCTASAPTLVP